MRQRKHAQGQTTVWKLHNTAPVFWFCCVALSIAVLIQLVISSASWANEPLRVDIYKPAQTIQGIAFANPLNVKTGAIAVKRAVELQKNLQQNIEILPIIRLVPAASVLGGVTLPSIDAGNIDFKRFQMSKADMLITMKWTEGDTSSSSPIEVALWDTFTGKLLLNLRYTKYDNLADVADNFSGEMLKVLIGRGDLFSTNLAFVRTTAKNTKNLFVAKVNGRNLQQITTLNGQALSPSWSGDGRFIVFSHMDARSHSLGVWERNTGKVTRLRLPGNTVIGPCFLPNNKIAVSLTTTGYPDIFLLNHNLEKERTLEGGPAINVSPSVDASGKLMAFCSNRFGNPHIFLKNLDTGKVDRISQGGVYNTDPDISPDGRYIVFVRRTDSGHRVFVHDRNTGTEKQISHGPGSDENPTFSSDGYFVVYNSSRGGASGLYLTTRNGETAKLLPMGKGNATMPAWSN